MPVSANLQRLLDSFAFIEDRRERLAALIDHARPLGSTDPALRSPAHLVPGCQTPVWLTARLEADQLHLAFACDSPLVKGLVALYIALYDLTTPADLLAHEPQILEQLGLARDLSPTRLHGLAAVRTRLKQLALAAS